MNVTHLARRFTGSLSQRPPEPADVAWVESILLSGELTLWRRFGVADQRHAILVGRRFLDRRPGASREEIASALLHDIGKIESDLGVVGRVVATIVGPRTERFRSYHDHEHIGSRLLAAAGSHEVTVALVAGDGRDPRLRDALADLRDADDV